MIPKVRNGLTQLAKAKEEHKPLLGHLLYVAAQVSRPRLEWQVLACFKRQVNRWTAAVGAAGGLPLRGDRTASAVVQRWRARLAVASPAGDRSCPHSINFVWY